MLLLLQVQTHAILCCTVNACQCFSVAMTIQKLNNSRYGARIDIDRPHELNHHKGILYCTVY